MNSLPDNWEDYALSLGCYPRIGWYVYLYFGQLLLYMPGDGIQIFDNWSDCNTYVEDQVGEPVMYKEG